MCAAVPCAAVAALLTKLFNCARDSYSMKSVWYCIALKYGEKNNTTKLKKCNNPNYASLKFHTERHIFVFATCIVVVLCRGFKTMHGLGASSTSTYVHGTYLDKGTDCSYLSGVTFTHSPPCPNLAKIYCKVAERHYQKVMRK